MKKLKTITIDEIRSWKPCYDPLNKLSEGWSGTALDILEMDHIPFEDQLWVVARTEVLSEKLMRLFAVWCARQVQHLMKDQRSIDAIDVAEKFAKGNASKAEMEAAWAAAQAAEWSAVGIAAQAAAGAAAWASRAAAGAAAWASSRAAAGAAAWASRAAAGDEAWKAQRDKLKEMIIAGIETGDSVCEGEK